MQSSKSNIEKPVFSQIINGDIREAKSGFIIQGVNAQGSMGSGLARSIMEKWPMVRHEYISQFKSSNIKAREDFLEIGSFHVVSVGDGKLNLYVVNLVSQEFYGYSGEELVSYPSIEVGLTNLVRLINKNNLEKVIHTPKIGCGLAGGDWEVVKDIFKRVIPDDFELVYWDYDKG